MTTYNAAYYVRTLNMAAHPEGGWYKETYRSNESIPQTALLTVVMKAYHKLRCQIVSAVKEVFAPVFTFYYNTRSFRPFTGLRAMRCGTFTRVRH